MTNLRNPIDMPGKPCPTKGVGAQANLQDFCISQVVNDLGLRAERTEAYPIAEVSGAEDNCLVVYRWNTGELFVMQAA